MRTKPDHEKSEFEHARLSPGAAAANLVSAWTNGNRSFGKRDLPPLIEALRAGPVLSLQHRDQIARLLQRLDDGGEPFEQRRKKRGRPRKSVFNSASVLAEHVAAEYVLALCVEGGWGAKPKALQKGLKLADRRYPGHDVTVRELDDAFRRYKTAGIVPRPSELFEECPPDEGRQLESGNATIEAYWEAMSDEVGSDPEQQALSQQSHLHAMAIFMGERLAMSVTPELARSLRASFANGLRSQFEADFAEALRSELDATIVEAFFMRLSALLPEALNSSGASGDVKNNPAKY